MRPPCARHALDLVNTMYSVALDRIDMLYSEAVDHVHAILFPPTFAQWIDQLLVQLAASLGLTYEDLSREYAEIYRSETGAEMKDAMESPPRWTSHKISFYDPTRYRKD